MKIAKVFFALLAAFAITSAQASETDNGGKSGKTLKADTQKSTLIWNGKKLSGEHTGTIQLASGSLQVRNNKLLGGSFEIDMRSITNTDLTDADYNAKLVGHLKSDDFFGVEKYPTASFTITKVEPIAGAKAGENNYTLSGDLTIKGTTHPVSFPAAVKISGNQAEAAANITVDRSKYNVRYGSASFFDNLGDNIIHDEFTIELKLVAAAE